MTQVISHPVGGSPQRRIEGPDLGGPVGCFDLLAHVPLDSLEIAPHLLRDPGRCTHELRRLVFRSGLRGQRDDHIREYFRHENRLVDLVVVVKLADCLVVRK